MSYKTGKYVEFAFDVELNDFGHWIPEGMKVELADNIKMYRGFTPVIITNAYTQAGDRLTIAPHIEHFSTETFREII
jgi:hypothetical protein